MKVTTFQNVVPFPCALIAVKLKFEKIQTTETPLSLPGAVEGVSVALANVANAIIPTLTALRRLSEGASVRRIVEAKGGPMLLDSTAEEL